MRGWTGDGSLIACVRDLRRYLMLVNRDNQRLSAPSKNEPGAVRNWNHPFLKNEEPFGERARGGASRRERKSSYTGVGQIGWC